MIPVWARRSAGARWIGPEGWGAADGVDHDCRRAANLLLSAQRSRPTRAIMPASQTQCELNQVEDPGLAELMADGVSVCCSVEVPPPALSVGFEWVSGEWAEPTATGIGSERLSDVCVVFQIMTSYCSRLLSLMWSS